MKFNPDKQIIAEYNPFDHNTGRILCQFYSTNILRLVAYFLKRYTLAECKYKIHNKELMVII